MVKINFAGNSLDQKALLQPTKEKIEAIVGSFNTWSFKRQQPSDAHLICERVAAAVRKNTPVPFVLYWGKGPRSSIAAPDVACLDYLKSMTSRIHEKYARGASVTLLLTDSHATLNGHAVEAVDAYYSAIDIAASERNFNCRRLSEVTRSTALLPSPQAYCAIQPDMLSTLTRSAAKWYDGAEPPEVAAEKYYALNMLERSAVQQAYTDHIFITFNGSEHRPLFPELMPIFYMYSIKKGTAVKPWFLASDSTQLTNTTLRSAIPISEGAQFRHTECPTQLSV